MSEETKAAALKREVLDHARDLFSHYGYMKTNIGDIAAKTGMSPGNLYRYFRNKQAIGEEVVREHMSALEIRMAAALSDKTASAEQAVRRFVQCGIAEMIELVRGDPKVVELADMICTGQSGILRAHMDWKTTQIEDMLARGIADGTLAMDDPRAVAETLYDMTISFWNPMTLAEFDLTRVPMRVERILDLVFLGLRSE